jgi:hypothetical protein
LMRSRTPTRPEWLAAGRGHQAAAGSSPRWRVLAHTRRLGNRAMRKVV